MREYNFVMPISITVLRKTKEDKKYSLGANSYRNWHYMVSNDLKKRYKELVKQQVVALDMQPVNKIKIYYKLFKPTKARYDKFNFAFVASKFFLDALVDLDMLPDDNDDFVKKETILPSEYDKNNGRIEIKIMEIE